MVSILREDVGERRIEKFPLRKAFEDYFPKVAWRQKEQFSDGVATYGSIFEGHGGAAHSDSQMQNARYRFP